jgi:hypothetical protein
VHVTHWYSRGYERRAMPSPPYVPPYAPPYASPIPHKYPGLFMEKYRARSLCVRGGGPFFILPEGFWGFSYTKTKKIPEQCVKNRKNV